jgi:8-oxo-dGTP diphosphatase
VAEDLWVVAGLVFDDAGRVLIAQRPVGKALAGRWEFPGGKVAAAAGETAQAALVRELREEIAIETVAAERVMLYAVWYPQRTIWLDVWRVVTWSGEPQGLDAQALEWVEPARLREHDILEADAPIVAWIERAAGGRAVAR